jgi:transposase
MSRETKIYTKEFKLMSVELSDTSSDLSALARELDVTPALLYSWRKEYSVKQGSKFPGSGKATLRESEQMNAVVMVITAFNMAQKARPIT